MNEHDQIRSSGKKIELGEKGEDIAANFLEDSGYHILKRNYRIGHSDIDICIIARDIENNFEATLTALATSALIDPKLEPIVIAEDEFESGNFGIIKEIKNTGVLV